MLLGILFWVKSMGGTLPEPGNSITTDDSGNVYSTGFFQGIVDFDPGADNFTMISNGFWDVFIQKLDSAGNFIWAKSMGASSGDEGNSITIDAAGNVYATGYFQWTADFDPGTAVFNLVSNGITDAFVQKLRLCFPNTGTDTTTACDSISWIDGIIYTANNDSATYTLTNSAGCDSVVTLNLTIVNSSMEGDTITACDSIIWIDSTTYTSSNNTATHTLTNVAGCDSIVTLNLTINSNTSTDVVSVCDSLTWIDGNTYASSNSTATHTLTNAAGCDSVVTLNLTINNNTGTDAVTVCDSYTWIDGNTYTVSNNTATHTLTNVAGCDSVVTLNLTINNSGTSVDVISSCISYTWIDSITYTSSNNTAAYTITGGAANGCDSIITLDLTINTVDVSVTTTDPTITANATGALYQWLEDCNNSYTIIPGETAKNFTATVNGDYAVEVTENGCADTSICVTITKVGIGQGTTLFNGVSIFPNPNDGIVYIDLGNLKEVSIHVFNVSGQLIYHKENIASSTHQFELNTAAGVYTIELSAQGEKQVYKVVKE